MGELWRWIAFILFGFVMFFETKGFEMFTEAQVAVRQAKDIAQQAQKLARGG